jgi:hypothetical protein
VLATVATLVLMVSEIVDAYNTAKTINITTPHTEKLVIVQHSTFHVLMAILYAVILLALVILDIVVAKEMFKE